MARTLRTSPTDIRRDESGFSIVETLVALVILVVGLLATLSTFDSAVFGSHTAERGSEAAAIAERELERMLARPYDELVNCTNGGTTPAHGGTDSRDPTYLIQSGATPTLLIRNHPRIDSDTSMVPGVASAGELFVLDSESSPACSVSGNDGTGVVSGPLPATTDTSDRLFGTKVYRFITWYDEPLCVVSGASTIAGSVNVVAAASGLIGVVLNSVNTLIVELSASVSAAINANVDGEGEAAIDLLCANHRDAKRITVAVVLPRVGNSAGLRKPVYLSTIVPDPADGIGVNIHVP